jgi:hypothetical protein
VATLSAAWSFRAQSARAKQGPKLWRTSKEAITLILEVLREDLDGLNRTNAEILKVELADVF